MHVMLCLVFYLELCSSNFFYLINRCLLLPSALLRSSRELALVLVLLSLPPCSIFLFLPSWCFPSPSLRGKTFGASRSTSRDTRQSLPRRPSSSSSCMMTRREALR